MPFVLFEFSDYMILHIDHPKKFTKKLLELINEVHKVVEYV